MTQMHRNFSEKDEVFITCATNMTLLLPSPHLYALFLTLKNKFGAFSVSFHHFPANAHFLLDFLWHYPQQTSPPSGKGLSSKT